MEFEVVLVDDGSTDETLNLAQHADAYFRRGLPCRIRWVSFSRNFGKEAAMFAGFQRASGDFVAVMDADLQDPPELLVEMLGRVFSGETDMAAARRMDREGEPAMRSWFARRFYALMNMVSDVPVPDGARDYRVMTREVVQSILNMPERVRFSKGIFSWVGFRTSWIEYHHVERDAGASAWNFGSLVRYAFDGIASFSSKPLSLSSFLGFLCCIASAIAVAVIVVRKMIFGDPVAGWPSLACLIAFTAGLQLLCLGIIGQYLAKIYEEVKARPLYIVARESANKANEEEES